MALVLWLLITPSVRSRRRFYNSHHNHYSKKHDNHLLPQTAPSARYEESTSENYAHWVLLCLLSLLSSRMFPKQCGSHTPDTTRDRHVSAWFKCRKSYLSIACNRKPKAVTSPKAHEPWTPICAADLRVIHFFSSYHQGIINEQKIKIPP